MIGKTYNLKGTVFTITGESEDDWDGVHPDPRDDDLDAQFEARMKRS